MLERWRISLFLPVLAAARRCAIVGRVCDPLFRENGSVRLRPENDSYEDLLMPAENVEVQGKLEWILKRPSR